MPAGIDLDRYRVVAWLRSARAWPASSSSSASRRATYHMLGYFDLVFFVPETHPARRRHAERERGGRRERRHGNEEAPADVIVRRRSRSWPPSAASSPTTSSSARKPPPYFASDEEHFLYGSVGTEAEQGVPYWIWLVLPRVFPEYLPRPGRLRVARASVGGDGHEMPIGLSKVTVGFPRVGINCAMCHTASYRARPTDPPTIYPAGPSHQTGPNRSTSGS